MPDPIGELNVSCPDEGKFYVCASSPTRFIGCCTTDPCHTNNGNCPDDKLRPASFDGSAYNLIPKQDCVASASPGQWYTCSTDDPPFMGCCGINPCSETGCPLPNLRAAQLSSNQADAAVFLLGSTTTSASTHGATDSATSLPKDSDNGGGGGLSQGVVIGMGVGASVVGLLILGILCFWCLKRRKRSREHNSSYEPYASRPGPPDWEPKIVSPYTPEMDRFRSPSSPNQHENYPLRQGQQSPPYRQSPHSYGHLSVGSSGSPYNSHSGFPIHPHNAETTAELSALTQQDRAAVRASELSAESYEGLGRESEMSGQTIVSQRHESYPAELADYTRRIH